MCKSITVDGEWKGVRGGKCSKPTSNSVSFSVTKSVATKHPVDVTTPHIARGCRPMLQLRDRRRSDRWTARYVTSMVGCVWEAEGRADARVGGCVSLHSPLVSFPPGRCPFSAWRRLMGPARSRNTDGWPGTRQRSLIASVRLHTKTTLLQYYEQFHAVTK